MKKEQKGWGQAHYIVLSAGHADALFPGYPRYALRQACATMIEARKTPVLVTLTHGRFAVEAIANVADLRIMFAASAATEVPA